MPIGPSTLSTVQTELFTPVCLLYKHPFHAKLCRLVVIFIDGIDPN